MRIPIITVGTGAPGGIDSVISGYINDGVFEGVEHVRLISHMGKNKFHDLILFLLSIFRFTLICLKYKKIILHCHMSYNGSFFRKLIFLIISNFFNNKTIIHLHGSEFKDYFNRKSRLIKKMIIWTINKCDCFIVLSEGWREYIYSISGKNPVVINNYVDIRPDLIHRESIDILFLGAFIKRKGIYELLSACSMLHYDYHLHLCGSGENNKVEELINELNLKRKVTLHGWIGKDKKKELLSSCTVMVLPTYNEGLPMTIIESMACEIPVLTTPVGAIPEIIIDGVSGYLVQPGDILNLAKKLDFILSSPNELQGITTRAKDIYLNNFTSLQVIPKLKGIYESLNNS
ncbi:TPA: glycosyltransferase family 4 protein [Vibrio cholerae]|nr:glycosyltransferase family 4 protein [Vibrio cholerae]HCJ7278469.1 glycosyltransferase family 4 protein [Vibrio cholerae]HCJ7316172.1 glycosyltransferase family 4 protein [Vibrio cholerae]